MHIDEAPFRSCWGHFTDDTCRTGSSVGPDDKGGEGTMNIARKVAIAVLTATMSFGLVGIAAPAHADYGWFRSGR